MQLWSMVKKVKKVGFLYSAAYAMTGPARFTISEVAVDWQEWKSRGGDGTVIYSLGPLSAVAGP